MCQHHEATHVDERLLCEVGHTARHGLLGHGRPLGVEIGVGGEGGLGTGTFQVGRGTWNMGSKNNEVFNVEKIRRRKKVFLNMAEILDEEKVEVCHFYNSMKS